MHRTFKLIALLFLSLVSLSAHAQTQINGRIITPAVYYAEGSGAPSGNCSSSFNYGAIYFDHTNFVMYACANGGWTQTGTASGGAPIASPAFTGVPTAPTAGPTVNTTQIATMAAVQTAQSNLVALNVKALGAIGDGTVHAACTYLGLANLAALQAYNGGIYSFATACTNTMDWLASQLAVNSLATIGGAVKLTGGPFVFDQTLVMPLNQDSAVGSAAGVYLIGDGEGATIIEPSVADFGANTALFSCGSPSASYADNSGAGSGRYGTIGACYGGFSDLTAYNPFSQGHVASVSSSTYMRGITSVNAPSTSGGTPIQMDGFDLGGRMNLHRVGAWGFRSGFNVVGDHMTWDQLDAEQNFCGMYWAPPSIYLTGDIIMTGHNFIGGGNKFAGVCVDKDAIIQGLYQTGELYLGYEPYGFIKFAGTSDSYVGGGYTGFMQNARFDVLQDEQTGNAAIWDDNIAITSGAISSNPQTTLGAVQINSIYASWGSGSGQKITTGGRGPYAWIGANTFNGFKIVNISGGASNFFTTTGQVAGIIMWNAGSSDGGIDISGDMPSILGQYTGIEFVGMTNAGSPACQAVQLHYPGVWDGAEIAIYPAATYPTPGTVLMVTNYQADTISNGTKPVTGVAQQYLTGNSAGGQCIAYANRGLVSGVLGSSATAGQLMVASTTSGQATAATTTVGGYVVGLSQNTGTNPPVWLNGMGSYTPGTQTFSSALASYAPLASPAFTGTPTIGGASFIIIPPLSSNQIAGTADSYATIQAALTAAQTGCGDVYIPPGTYKTSAALTYSANCVRVRGAGATATQITASATGYNTMVLGNGGGNQTLPTGYVRDIRLTGAGKTNAGFSALQINGLTQFDVRDVAVDTADIGIDFINNNYGTQVTNLRACFFSSCNVGTNIRTGAQSGNDLVFNNIWSGGLIAGVSVSGGTGDNRFFGGQINAGLGSSSANDLAGALILTKDYLTGATTGESSADLYGVSFEGTEFAHLVRAFGETNLSMTGAFLSPDTSSSAPAIDVFKGTGLASSTLDISSSQVGGFFSAANLMSVAGSNGGNWISERNTYWVTAPTINSVSTQVNSIVYQSGLLANATVIGQGFAGPQFSVPSLTSQGAITGTTFNNATINYYSGTTNLTAGLNGIPSGATGQYNTNFAVAGMTGCTSCTLNAGIGYGALTGLTSGTGNTADGVNALANISTTNYNIGVGLNAGRYITGGSTANTGAVDGIFVGEGTMALAASDTNETVICFACAGNGSNTTTLGNSSTTDTYLSGTVHANVYSTSSTAAEPLNLGSGIGSQAQYMGFDNNRVYVGFDGLNATLQGNTGKGVGFAYNNSTFGSGYGALIDTSGNFGVGTNTTAATSDSFYVTPAGVATGTSFNQTTANCLAATTVTVPCAAYQGSATALTSTYAGSTVTLYSSAAPANAVFKFCPTIFQDSGSGTVAGTAQLQVNWTTPGSTAVSGANLGSITFASSGGAGYGSCTTVSTKSGTTLSFNVLAVSGSGTVGWEYDLVVDRLR